MIHGFTSFVNSIVREKQIIYLHNTGNGFETLAK